MIKLKPGKGVELYDDFGTFLEIAEKHAITWDVDRNVLRGKDWSIYIGIEDFGFVKAPYIKLFLPRSDIKTCEAKIEVGIVTLYLREGLDYIIERADEGVEIEARDAETVYVVEIHFVV